MSTRIGQVLAVVVAAGLGFLASTAPVLKPLHSAIGSWLGLESPTTSTQPDTPPSARSTAVTDGPADEIPEQLAEKLFQHASKKPDTPRLDTPDFAVKSWWAARDAEVAVQVQTCRFLVRLNRVELRHTFSPVSTDNLRRRMSNWDDECIEKKYRRQIDEVKLESASRAVVYATLWPLTIPANISDDEKKNAEKGTRIRYVLENAGSGSWLVADIFRYIEKTQYTPESWDQRYEENFKPYWSGTVWMP
jgi:hypothetical protein